MGGDGVDPDAVGAELPGHRLGEGVDATLGRPVGRRGGEVAGRSGDRGDVDDGAGPLRTHRRQGGLDAVEGPAEVDAEDAVALGGGVVGERAPAQDPGVVDQHLQATEGGLDLLDHGGDLVGVGHVGGDRHGLATTGGDLLGHLHGALAVGQVVDGNHGAAAGQHARGGRADPAPAPGDQRDPVAQVEGRRHALGLVH
jgi:hypothetical protein